jgi:16S rRNA (uracil1498-N3)-methyltransferase
MQRFFSEKACPETLRISASERPESYHQMTRVLRMQVGDTCAFFENGGDDIVYEIIGIDKKAVELKRISVVAGPKPDALRITLYQALPNKLEKLEFILQKGVETGIDEFVFFPAERSQKPVLLEKKYDRLRQIAVEAVEQSGGNRVPGVFFAKDLSGSLAKLPTGDFSERIGADSDVSEGMPTLLPAAGERGEILVAHTDGQATRLRDVGKNAKNIALFVGPEGGFSPREIEGFRSIGATFLDLGCRILRTETAGVVTAFALKAR